MFDAVLAQSGPFGVGRPSAQPVPPADGLVGWIMTKQAEFYRGMSAAVRASKADSSAVLGLFGLSFAYGIFHAAGPGHGKAVISSYLVANEQTWKRGVVLSFASAMLQALVAVAMVLVAAVLLNATAKTMGDTVRIIEIVSYALIILLGLRLLWVKGRGFIEAWRGDSQTDHHKHAHHHGHSHSHDHAHEHGDHHDHDSIWSHAHGPEPQELAGPGGWRRGFTAVLAVGLRPCSGAILVLVFALAQGLFWAGVVATFIMGLGTAITVAVIATLAVTAKSFAKRLANERTGSATLAMRGIEVAAAFVVLAFGVLLLMGYMASERIAGF
ncbi:MAG: nickel/cobalt transporter [Rhizobiales bacterium]|nr:nickel/cobalt transporter [Hyphomicrobiales bacterium]